MQDVVGEKPVTVRLAPDVYRQVERLAKAQKRSISAQLAYLIEQALKQARQSTD
jgi:hypothetical protein